MKKALKIIRKLETAITDGKSKIIVKRVAGKIIIANNENRNLIQLLYLCLLLFPIVVFYFEEDQIGFFESGLLIFWYSLFLYKYYKESFLTDHTIEIDVEKEEIELRRLSFFRKLIGKDKIIKTKKSNKVLKENSPGDDIGYRLFLQTEQEKIPLLDLNGYRDNMDQVFLLLKLLVVLEK